MTRASNRIVFALSLSVLCLGIVGTRPATAEPAPETAFLDVMRGYLDVAGQYTELASRPEASIYFAIEGIVEVYERRGELDKAVEHLEKMLEDHGENQTVRNLLRFKLRDLYNETGRSAQALRELDAIVAENARRPPSDRPR